MVKTSLLLFLCLRLFSTLVGSSAAKLMMAALPPTQARTCQNFTNSLTWPVRNSRESTKANTTKIYLRKFCRQSNQRAGLGNNLCSNKHQSRDCCCDKESYEICIAARRVLNPLFRAWHQAYYTMRVFRFWQKSFLIVASYNSFLKLWRKSKYTTQSFFIVTEKLKNDQIIRWLSKHPQTHRRCYSMVLPTVPG